MNRFRFKACIKCRGDLVLDEGDWLCLQCGTYYYTGLYRKPPSADQPKQIIFPDHQEKSVASRWLSVGHGAGGEPSLITPEISEPISESGLAYPSPGQVPNCFLTPLER